MGKEKEKDRSTFDRLTFMERRAFLRGLVASAVVAGAGLPVGLNDDWIVYEFDEHDSLVMTFRFYACSANDALCEAVAWLEHCDWKTLRVEQMT